MRHQRFEVLVAGTVSPDLLADCGADIHAQTITVVRGVIRDQSQLHAILRQLQGLGIDVLSLHTNQVRPDED